MEANEKKTLISKKTLLKAKQVEDKIYKSLKRIATETECSLGDLYIRIIGRDDDFPAFAVYEKNNKLADVGVFDIITLNPLEMLAVNEEDILENIYRNLTKILLGSDQPKKLSDLQVWIYTREDITKPLFYLYKKEKPHEHIKSYQII